MNGISNVKVHLKTHSGNVNINVYTQDSEMIHASTLSLDLSNEGLDEPAYMRNLSKAFFACTQKAWI